MSSVPRHPDAAEYARLETLTETRRHEVLRHAEGCTPCREVLTRNDPTAIFALLSVQPIPEFSLARLTRNIDAAIDTACDADPRARRFGWRAVASIAASLMLAGFFGYQVLQDDPVRTAATVEDLGSLLRATADPGTDAVRGDARLLPVFDDTPERGVELISSPGEAEVVDFALGETQVVMIFDKALDI